MPDITPIAEELGFTAAVGVMLPNSHFGRVWKDPENDNCIWQLVLMEADKDTPIGNGMATSLADATNALFNYAQCWVIAGETVADERQRNQMTETVIDPMGFTAANRRGRPG